MFLKGFISGVDEVISPLISVLSNDFIKFAWPKRRRYELVTTFDDLFCFASGEFAVFGLIPLLSSVDFAGTSLSGENCPR